MDMKNKGNGSSRGAAIRLVAGLTGAAALLLLAGCFVLSSAPVYDEQSLVYDEGLAGVWAVPGQDGETWEFVPTGKSAWTLIVHKGDSPVGDSATDAAFSARLAEVCGRRYLDLLPDDPESLPEFAADHLVRAHSIWLYSRDGDALTMGMLGREAVDRLAAEGVDIPRVGDEDKTLLTLDTADLQELLCRQSDALFPETDTLQRIH